MEERKRWLDCARALAIILVTFNHAVNRSFSSSDPYMEFVSRPDYVSWNHSVLFVLSRLGVPLFLMISGVLLLKRDYTQKDVLVRFYRHNFLSVLICAEIWYAVMFWFLMYVEKPDFASLGMMHILGRSLQNQLFLNQLTMGSMWYMPMILTMYLLIPMVSLALHLFPKMYTYACVLLVTVTSMLVPNINTYLGLVGSEFRLTSALASYPLYSRYMVYIIAGYLISEGMLAKIKDVPLASLLAVSLSGEFFYQHWSYGHPNFYSASYSSVGILVISALLFEVIRRIMISDRMNAVFLYLSKRAFGIYFVHICIMTWIKAFPLKESTLSEMAKFSILEISGVLGSLLLIAILEKVKWCRQYLFLIK